MTPNFALILSFEGIRLLQRIHDGWALAGEVSLDCEDLQGALYVLRQTAEALAPEGVQTKVIVPNEQIKYLTLKTGEADEAARWVAARAALDGATPYKVDELAFDLASDGPRTYVAAVARETLDEAESFAVAHGFNPISFVAAPEPLEYLGEPFFGETSSVKAELGPGIRVTRDARAVAITGPVVEPASPAPSPAEPPEPERTALPDPTPDVADEIEGDPVPEKPASFRSRRAAPEPSATAPDDDTPDAIAEEAAAPSATETEVQVPAAAAQEAETTVTADAPEPDTTLHTPHDTNEAAPRVAVATSDADLSFSDDAPEPPGEAEAQPPQDDTEPPLEQAYDTADAPPRAPNIAAHTNDRDPDIEAAQPQETVLETLAATDAEDLSESFSPGPEPERAERSEPSALYENTPAQPEAEPDSSLPNITAASIPNPAFDEADASDGPATPEIAGFVSRRKPATVPKLGGVTRTMGGPVPQITIDRPTRKAPLRPDPIDAPATDSAKVSLDPISRPQPEAPAPEPVPDSEAERLTIFGARSRPVRNKPPFLGLALTVILLVVMAGIAAFATGYIDNGLSRLFTDRPAPDAEISTPAQTAPETTAPADAPLTETAPDPAPEKVSRPAELSVEDATAPDAPLAEDTADMRAIERRYATDGIWILSPIAPQAAAILPITDLYQPGIDRSETKRESHDALALPRLASLQTDDAFLSLAPPAEPGIRFELDARGLVIPTPEGALNPEGILVYAGRPPVAPTVLPDRSSVVQPEDPTIAALRETRPRARPESLIEDNERANFGGISRSELAAFRPVARPALVRTPEESEAEEPDAPATAQAVAVSLRPDARPRNIARIVARATPREEPAAAAASTSASATARAVAPKTVTPSIPSSTTVAKAATSRNVLNLNRINLIGVFGKPSDRRAFVRLKNGRVQRVSVGDRLDGGQVIAIGDSELRYQKRGRNVVLQMPQG